METYQNAEDLSDEDLQKQISEKIDGNEEESEVEPQEEEESTEEPKADESDEEVEIDLEEETESAESEETEETTDEEETSKKYTFKDQDEAEKSYQSLLELQKRQATELGEIRKQLAKREELPTPDEETGHEDLSDDDLAELIISDPTKAVSAIREQIKRDIASEQKVETEREKNAKRIDDSEVAIDEFFKMDDYKDMDDDTQKTFFSFIANHHNINKAVTVQDLKNYYNWMNYDKNIELASKNARGKAIDDITSSSPKLKTLSSAKNAKAKGKPEIKEGMTREQVEQIAEGMSEEELEKQIEALENLDTY